MSMLFATWAGLIKGLVLRFVAKKPQKHVTVSLAETFKNFAL
jgi:hypothetical protein